MLLEVGAASMASSCTEHEMEDLNTSDHLLISVEFSWKLEKTNQPQDFQWEMIDWRMAKRDGALEIFQAEIQENLYLLLGNRCDSTTIASYSHAHAQNGLVATFRSFRHCSAGVLSG